MGITSNAVSSIPPTVCSIFYSARNNLTSTVDLVWSKSLEKQSQYSWNQPKVKKQEELEEVTRSYTKAIQKAIQNQSKIDKNTFRVMPNHPVETNLSTSHAEDSLTKQLKTFQEHNNNQTISQNQHYPTQAVRNQIVEQAKRKPIQNSSNVSSTVFGYNINYQTFKRQSYMSKILSDRLQPYLSKTVDTRVPRYSSFHINNPVPNYYA